MKILVLPSFYPMKSNYLRGGFFEEQTKLIKALGVNVSVIFNEDRSISSLTLKKLREIHFQVVDTTEANLNVYRKLSWNLVPKKFDIGRKIWVNTSIKLVKSYIAKYGKPDLFHVHCAFDAGYVANYFKENHDIPYIITEHSSIFGQTVLSASKVSDVLKIYADASKVVVVSKPFRNLIAEKVGFDKEKITVIPNFIDTDFFNPSLVDLGNKNVIFTVCHHEKNKRLDRLIDAFALIVDANPDFKLFIGGLGKETKNLLRQVESLNLSKNVAFLGFLDKDQVRHYMKLSTVFVLPSDFETFGVVLIEAMAMGIPVVATSCGGPEDIISPETGVIVNKDSRSLANGIQYIISNIETYNKDTIRSHALKRYSGHVVAKRYIEMYSCLVSH